MVDKKVDTKESLVDVVEVGVRAGRQVEVCRRLGVPCFAPGDGVCFCCGGQIYERLDGFAPVTGCPLCLWSFCE
jgi:hypothetical protein